VAAPKFWSAAAAAAPAAVGQSVFKALSFNMGIQIDHALGMQLQRALCTVQICGKQTYFLYGSAKVLSIKRA